jgi:hypothetical protein
VTEREAHQVVMIIAANWRSDLRGMEPEEIRAWSKMFREGILDLDFAEVKAAVDRVIKTEIFLPKVATIRNALIAATRGQRRSGAEAWGDVIKAVSRYGYNRTPVFDDPIVARVVDALSWKEICNSENATADRARFIQAYDQLVAQGLVEAQISHGASAPALPSRGAPRTLAGGAVKALQPVDGEK